MWSEDHLKARRAYLGSTGRSTVHLLHFEGVQTLAQHCFTFVVTPFVGWQLSLCTADIISPCQFLVVLDITCNDLSFLKNKRNEITLEKQKKKDTDESTLSHRAWKWTLFLYVTRGATPNRLKIRKTNGMFGGKIARGKKDCMTTAPFEKGGARL